MDEYVSVFDLLLIFVGEVFNGFLGLLGNLFLLPIIISALFLGVFMIRGVINNAK